MYKLSELCKKLQIEQSEGLTEQLKNLGYKIENGLISGKGDINGQMLNAEDGLALLVNKANSALTKKEEGGIQTPPQPINAPHYQVQNPFNLSVQNVVQTGQDQMTAAAQTGHAIGTELSNVRNGALWEAYFKQTFAHQQQNIDVMFAVDQAIVGNSNVDVSGIVRELGEGKYRPSLP